MAAPHFPHVIVPERVGWEMSLSTPLIPGKASLALSARPAPAPFLPALQSALPKRLRHDPKRVFLFDHPFGVGLGEPAARRGSRRLTERFHTQRPTYCRRFGPRSPPTTLWTREICPAHLPCSGRGRCARGAGHPGTIGRSVARPRPRGARSPSCSRPGAAVPSCP